MNKILGFALVIALSLFCAASGSIFIGAQNKNFSADTSFDDDLYLAGNSVRFESQVSGDLIGSCRDFVYSGQSAGSVNWAAQRINIIGPVAGSVRAFAQSIEINSTIGRNLVAFGQTVSIGPSTEIAKDATIYAGKVTFEGKVNGRLKIDADEISISGVIDGDLNTNARELEIKPNAVIKGNFTYQSSDEIKIPDGALIEGETKWIKIDKDAAKEEKYRAFRSITTMIMGFTIINIIFSIGLFLLSLLMGNVVIIPLIYLSLIASGLTVLGLTKSKAIKSVSIMKERPWVSLGLGLVLLLIFPLAVGLAMITLIGIPIAVILLFGCGILLFIGAIYTALFIGSLVCRLVGINKKEPSMVCLLLGIIILASLSLIPVLGVLVIIATLMFGLGSTVLSFDIFNVKKLSETLAPETENR
jgi:cytoskeletal protein CcmA (bactofilin family)